MLLGVCISTLIGAIPCCLGLLRNLEPAHRPKRSLHGMPRLLVSSAARSAIRDAEGGGDVFAVGGTPCRFALAILLSSVAQRTF
jgi:hypothetical protein